MKKNLYLAFAIIGAILPSTQFIPWGIANGMDIAKMINEMFANKIAAGVAIDAVTAAAFLAVYIYLEQKKLKTKHIWAPIAGIFIFGLAFALPFYLYLREISSQASDQS